MTTKLDQSDKWFSCAPHDGEHYQSVLKRFHGAFKPATYLEIGTAEGKTLELAKCATVAVDPFFQISTNVVGNKPSCQFFQMTSDDFFAHHKLDVLLGGRIEFAFLDGMHLFEYLLRDFMNTEKYSKKTSTLFMHDCIPTDSYLARRDPDDLTLSYVSPHVMWWAGDVWKVVAILKKYRPELRILAFDAPPTGLISITNLAPDSCFLSENYDEIIREFSIIENDRESLQKYWESLEIIDTKLELPRYAPG